MMDALRGEHPPELGQAGGVHGPLKWERERGSYRLRGWDIDCRGSHSRYKRRLKKVRESREKKRQSMGSNLF